MELKSLRHFYKTMKLRLRHNVIRATRHRIEKTLACRYRSLLEVISNVCVIGITGSVGKTTTTELIAAILEKEGRIRKGSEANDDLAIARAILGISPRDRFCVCEASGHKPGAMEKATKMLQPHIGVVTHVGQDHYSNYRSLEATAQEKGKLVEFLPAHGTAVLNADDPNVYPMRNRTKARVITYGLSENATVRGENVSSLWPNLMSLEVCYQDKRFKLQTRFAGVHWAYTSLALKQA